MRYAISLALSSCGALLLMADASNVTPLLTVPRVRWQFALAADGAIYFGGNQQVLKFAGGTVTVVAGTGERGFSGDGGAATAATITDVTGVAVDNAGNVYFSDAMNSRVRRVAASTGIITTIAGNGSMGTVAGDGGPATQAVVPQPLYIAVDPSNSWLYISGYDNIRRVNLATGIITRVAGEYGVAGGVADGNPPTRVNRPTNMAFDPAGNLVFIEGNYNRVRRIDRVTNLLSTIAEGNTAGSSSSDGLLATETILVVPETIAYAPDGALYIGERYRIRRVDPVTARTMTISALPGSGCAGPGNNVPASSVGVCPDGLAVNAAGELLVSQQDYIFKVSFSRPPTSTVLSGSPNPSTSGQSVTLTATVSPSAATGRVFFQDGAALVGTVNVLNGVAALTTSGLTPGDHSLSAVYEGSLDHLSSQSVAVNHRVRTTTATAISVSPGFVLFGDTVQLTASVSPAAATGTVEFLDGAAVIGSAQLNAGVASLSTPSLAVGTRSLSARYLGSGNHAPSSSAAATLFVGKANLTVSVSSSASPSSFGSTVTFTASVSRSNATGTVQFSDSGLVLGAATVANGTASFATSALGVGDHFISAYYVGDANFNGATSGSITHTVGRATTATTLTSSANPSIRNQSVTFTISVSPSSATGSVQFLDGTTVLSTQTPTNGVATFTTSALSVATHAMKGTYLGSTNHLPSQSPILNQVVNRR